MSSEGVEGKKHDRRDQTVAERPARKLCTRRCRILKRPAGPLLEGLAIQFSGSC
jgi:hypothetical protein